MIPLAGSSFSRRVLLRFAALGAGTVAAVALSACGGSATTVATVTTASARTSSATSAPVAATSSKAAAPATATTATGSKSANASASASSATVSAAPAAPAGSAVTLEFWTTLTDPISKSLLNPYAQKFMQQHADIKVNMRFNSGGNNYEKYTSPIVAGTPPDGILTSSFPIAVEWAANGQIQPMDEWAGRLGVKSTDYFPWIWAMQHFHGKLWCLIQEYDTNVFVWNKALFRSAGLNADAQPTQLSALDAAAAKLDHKQSDGTLAQVGFIPWLSNKVSLWIAARGGDIYDATNGKWTFNTEQARDTLTWYQQYLRRLGNVNAVNQFMKPFTGKITPVGSGKLAMQIVGDWVPLMSYDKDSPSLEYGVGVIPTAPGVKPGANTVIGSDTFVLPVGVKHPQESMQFMLYMDSAEPVLAWCLGEANVPPTLAMANDARFVQGFPYGKLLVDMAKPELLHPFPVAPTYSDATGFLNTAVSNVLKGTTTVEAALTQAQQLADQKQQAFSAAKPGW